jgi:peptidoglycan-associated lipoprotein
MKTLLKPAIKSFLCIMAFSFMMTSVWAELSPFAYSDSQLMAGEKLSVRVLAVDIIRQERKNKITVQAEVLKVGYTESFLSPGPHIIIEYGQEYNPEGKVGPGPVPLLHESEETLAFLTHDKDDGVYYPAAGSMSFGPYVVPTGVLETIYYDYDSFDVPADQVQILKRNATTLLRITDLAVMIEGYTDERGTEEYNLHLGDRKASRVKEELILLGVSEERLHVISYGEEKPRNTEHNEDAWAENRRVEFRILSLDSEER